MQSDEGDSSSAFDCSAETHPELEVCQGDSTHVAFAKEDNNRYLKQADEMTFLFSWSELLRYFPAQHLENKRKLFSVYSIFHVHQHCN